MMLVQRLNSLFVLLAILLSFRGLFVDARKDGNQTTKLPTTTPAIREGDKKLHQLNKRKGDPLPLLPLPDGKSWTNTWTNTETSTSFRLWRYVHHRFTGAEVAECNENGLPMKVKHIYYWPGDHISFTCKVCQRGLDSNGKIKMWGWAAKVYDFFDHYQKNKKLQHADVGVQFLQLNSEINTSPNEFYGSDDSDPSYMPGNRDQSREGGFLPHIRRQTFEQIGKTLHIHKAEARAAGVYFCYDDTAIKLVRYFYILHAMTPINRANWMDDANFKNRLQLSPDMGKMVCESVDKKGLLPPPYQCGNDCGKPIYMYPDTQWKFNWRPIIYKPENEPICDKGHLKCEKYLKLHPDAGRHLAIRKVPETPIHLHVLKRSFNDKRFYTDVALAFRWEPWSRCDSGRTHQRREGHCVLQLVDGKKKTNSENTLIEASRWMSRLDSIFRVSGGKNTTFVRLHSSTVMTMIMDQPVKTDCGTRERSKSVQKIDEFYEQVIFPSLDIPGEQFNRKKFTLNNEWRACFKYKHSGENEGSDGSYSDIVGTYVIEIKQCP
ncbi:unnamed protein product, partial [Mesorhabditis belari]|uniref:Uncharacterized protein n=1 Tax=Mesorhabditis belari TaxID=2138241 RepID=A0AAF3EI46_9BILA